ncbi:Fic family protein [Peijinzhouia sedimentorum]
MKTLGNFLEELRLAKGLVIRELSAISGIDAALISKFEKGKRIPTEANIKSLSLGLDIDFEALRKKWLEERIVNLVKYEQDASEILALAESRAEYLLSENALILPKISSTIEDKLQILDELKLRWKDAKPLNATQISKMKEYFNVEYTYESNRIEGNTMTLQETHLVINEGLTIAGKSMREHLEAVNHNDAIQFIDELSFKKESFSKRSLMEIHYLVLKGIDRENAGKFRSVPVRISGSEHVPPQPYMLEKLMEDYFFHFQQQKHILHPVLLAAEMHERLVSIHPFVDGNGRTSRLVMNMLLLKNGFTIANLKGDFDSRMTYYKALENVQLNNNPEPFYNLVIDAVTSSLQRHLELAGG